MTFAEHTKRNWVITLFAAIFFAAIVSMIFLNDPRETIVVGGVFVASSLLIFGAILGGWHLISNRKESTSSAA